jgi:DNA-binding transcriptional ArsR family regulator
MRDYRMDGEPDIAALASLIGDEARAAMLLALVAEKQSPMSSLAARARIGLPAASKHLARLEGGGLVVSERRGRQRHYQLAGEHVAQLLEYLSALAPVRPTRTLSESTRLDGLRVGRTCYDHLAGRLGVGLFEALVDRAALMSLEVPEMPPRKVRSALGSVDLGPAAEEVFARIGVEVHRTRTEALACPDWTEDRPHLSGRLGAAVCTSLFERGWVRARPESRAVRLTPHGEAGLQDALGWKPVASSGPAPRSSR